MSVIEVKDLFNPKHEFIPELFKYAQKVGLDKASQIVGIKPSVVKALIKRYQHGHF